MNFIKRELILLFAVALVCSCSKTMPNDVIVTNDSDGEVVVSSSTIFPEERFEDEIIGYGWHHVHTYEFQSDGTLSSEDWWTWRDGGSPYDYHIGEDGATEFFICDAYPDGYCYANSTYRYADGVLTFSRSNKVYIICSLQDDLLTMIDYKGYENRPLYCIYTRMTDEELAKTRSTYNKTMAELEAIYDGK